MALRSNSKKACENIRAYIMQGADYIREYADFEGVKLDGEKDILAFAWDIFTREKKYEIERNYNCASFGIFKDWAQGLAPGGLFCYFYNRPAVDDLGAILEETEAEKARYTEEQAEELLTRLIYRELEKAKYPASSRFIFKEC